jgi:hypothetical protein
MKNIDICIMGKILELEFRGLINYLNAWTW